MKSKLFLAALPLVLATGSLAAQDVFELHGYMRAGVGRSSNGGEQVTFYLPNTGDAPTAGPGYRLGNETDNYIELAMDVRAYEKGAESFKLHFRPTFRSYYAARDASADAGGNVDHSMMQNNNQMTYMREAWGEATGFFGNGQLFKDATLWVGRRFYQRQDLHIRDMWYWNNSGDGVGIENINLGFAKLHYAFIQHDKGNVDEGWGAGHFPGGIQVDQYNRGGWVIGSHDIRLSDIKLWSGGSLTVGYQYNDNRSRADITKPDTNKAGGGNNASGSQFHVMWNQSNVLGGDNRVYATVGNGNTFYNFYNGDANTHNTWWEVMDVYYIKPVTNLDIQGCVIYRSQSTPNADSTNPDGSAANWAKQDWLSVGIRPMYFFTKHFSVAAELGYDQLKFSSEDYSRHLFKQTLALQWSPMANAWSRPSIRVFVTHANWNKQANNWGSVDGGQFTNQGKTEGLTYGAQVEAWW